MEQNTSPQKFNFTQWLDGHKVITCFSVIVLFIFGSALFNPNPHQVAVKGASTSIPTDTPTTATTDTPIPTATPTITPSDTPAPTLTLYPTHAASLAPTQETIQSTQTPPTQEQGLSNNNYYMNSSGNEVHSPANANDGSVPAGATAKCSDGTYSFSQHHSGTCSHHGGVAQWL